MHHVACSVSTSASLVSEKNSGTGQRINYSGLRATTPSAREKNCKCTLDMLRTQYCRYLTCFTIIIVVTSHGIVKVERRAASDIGMYYL